MSFWTVQVAAWAIYATALMLPWLGQYPIAMMLPSKIAIAWSGLLASSGLRALYRLPNWSGASIWRLVTLAAIGSLVAGLLWDVIVARVVGASGDGVVRALGRIDDGIPRFSGAMYHALVLFAWSISYLGVRHYRALVAERERSLRALALARDARLEALRYQISPHFLFNALNAISTLVVTRRTSEAESMLARLGDLLRSSLDPEHNGMISLDREIELVHRYLAVEQVRFGDRLQVVIEVGGEAGKVTVPAMILQPLVENAVRHAVAPNEQRTTIAINAQLQQGTLVVTVSDDGTGTGIRQRGMGLGLANTRERLEQVYGKALQFVLTSGQGGGLRVAFTIPATIAAEP